MKATYEQFLVSKHPAPVASGFEPEHPINPKLFPFQADIVRWALRLGKAACFADTGLGKTGIQLVWSQSVCDHTGGDALILAPLSVARQTQREGVKFSVEVTVCRTQADVRPGVNVTNYEMLKHFDPSKFTSVVLDESSILKSYTGKTKIEIIDAFRDTLFKLACTATPSPNDHIELGNHADFLDVPGAGEMLARWFVNDTMEAGNYRLKGHAEKDFWKWVASWAVSISNPSDLGYSDEGFILPPLNVHEEIVEVDTSENAGGFLFRMPDLSATSIHREMRLTAADRAKRAFEIFNRSPEEHWVIWCNTDYEQDEVDRLFGNSAFSIRGKTPPAKREAYLDAWFSGERKVLVAKGKMFGWGVNWQHCHKTVMVGVSYSYELMYQLIRRFWRFGQTSPVDVHVVLAETEAPVLRSIVVKQQAHESMKSSMSAATSGAGLLAGPGDRRLVKVQESAVKGNGWKMMLGDNCKRVKIDVGSETVGLTVSSLPFENLYIYSDSEADVGNSKDSAEFFEHMGYLIPELLRVTIPGRLCIMHCKHLPLYRGRDGEAGVRDFPGEVIRAFTTSGWTLHSPPVVIWKDPVTEMQRTKNHGLLYKVVCKDSSASRVGMPDYLCVFRKPGSSLVSDSPVCNGSNPERFDHYVGMEPPDPNAVRSARILHQDPDASEESTFARYIPPDKNGRWSKVNPFPPGSEDFRLWSIAAWQRYASPVWMDINQMDVLSYRQARGENDERHICPLQLDVIERCIHLWSNPGDLVLDPFAGVGSTCKVAIDCGRRALGIELKPSYWKQSVLNCKAAEREQAAPDLFAAETAELSTV